MPDMLAPMQKVNAQPTLPTRRNVLAAGAVGVGAAGLLAACGSDDEPTASATSSAPTSAAPSPSTSSSASGGAAPADALASTSDIPVGGGRIFADKQVVVTQPAAGDFKAFSAQCTHQGCLVSQVRGDEIVCTCHGSAFSTSDGSVLAGPATSPLPSQSITVEGSSLVLG